MDWGEGTVLAVAEAEDVGGGYCDSCDRPVERGLLIDVAAEEYGAAAPLTMSLCESCFGDPASEMGTATVPGTRFLILIVPPFADRS